MKKVLAILLVAVLAFVLVACGGGGGGTNECANHIDGDSDGKCDTCGKKITAPEGGYPRYTGFDDTPYKARANLQNCRVVYTYDADCEGDPNTVLTGELVTCKNRLYSRTFTLYGYDEHIDGNAEYAQPDNHMAYVLTDEGWTVYDFYRKIIAKTDEADYYNAEWDDALNVSSFSDSTLRYWECYLEDFEGDSYSGITEKLEPIEAKSICGKSCDGWIRYDNYTVGTYSLDTYECRAWVDPETHWTLRYEWYAGDYDLSDVSRIFEVTSFDLNCVSYESFDRMIADLVEEMGGESEFRAMSWGDYWGLFE